MLHMSSLIQKKLATLCWLLLAFVASSALAQKDTDGDGLLDVLDVAGFDANASGDYSFLGGRGIEDLDGS